MNLSKCLMTVGLVAVAVLAVVGAYFGSGTTFHANVGFGGPSVTLRTGTFYYDWYSDIGPLDHAAGFASQHEGGIRLTPLGLLSSDDLPPFLSEPLLRVRCGEREYLIAESELTAFHEWVRERETVTSFGTPRPRHPVHSMNGCVSAKP